MAEESIITNTIDETGEQLAVKYLTFMLDGEEYGLQILQLQEIIRLQKIITVPKVPDFIRGVINLRGRVVPVIDLRKKFGMAATEDTERTCIVVVQITHADIATVTGIVIDEVREVCDCTADQIEAPPSFSTSVDLTFITGIVKVNGTVKILLNIDNVLTATELSTVSSIR